ncbi:MAG: L,D-transpeptidase [Gammaproteobacteria bacterium]|nr:L,D-transpeptidase [Gammaproteobacteria bacterium]
MATIKVNVSDQLLRLYDANEQLITEYPVSTSMYGVGNREGSFKTPLGYHQVCEKIGAGMPQDEVFIGRQAQGCLADLQARNIPLPDDVITARIIRLAGKQAGINMGDGIDSFARYIYIHGTADEENISKPVSHGCIRMRNQDIIQLYEKVELNTDVWIED